MQFKRKTDKLYYQNLYAHQANAVITKIGDDFLELSATIAFPEGGGQESDHGEIMTTLGQRLRFDAVKKIYTHPCGLAEFPDLQVDGVIWHMIRPEDRSILANLQLEQLVSVKIDVLRRAQLSLSHTASHVLYMAIGQHRPDAIPGTIGCHIKIDGARFDFSVSERFSANDLENIQTTANQLISNDLPISLSAHPSVPDARLWHCAGQTIPCGGTHLDRTGAVGLLQIKRRGLGSGKERLSCTFPMAQIDISQYQPLIESHRDS